MNLYFFSIGMFFNHLPAAGQAMLQGSSSWDNFIGSPGMWVLVIGVVLYLLFVLVTTKKSKQLNP